MAGSKTNFFEDKVLNVLRGTNITAPTTIYMGLMTTAPGESGPGTEVSGGSYARVAFTLAAPSGNTVSNSAQVDFPTPTAGWGTVVGIGVFDASSGGNMWLYSDQTPNKTINTGDPVFVPVGAFTWSED